MPNVFQRFVAAVNREFERRAQRVSQPADEPSADHAEEAWDEGEVEIANVPRGTMLEHNSGVNRKSE
ncbi:MAG TPA: hypothetical protein VFT66_08675 [Roseiflexaceae bacterium]|jgi:hypothetical protein|nr:hypothetical protein [Roseiflexaceae bacterium]